MAIAALFSTSFYGGYGKRKKRMPPEGNRVAIVFEVVRT
jgi:hypothetical protein